MLTDAVPWQARIQFSLRTNFLVECPKDGEMEYAKEVVSSLEVLRYRHDPFIGNFGKQFMHHGQKNGEIKTVKTHSSLILSVGLMVVDNG